MRCLCDRLLLFKNLRRLRRAHMDMSFSPNHLAVASQKESALLSHPASRLCVAVSYVTAVLLLESDDIYTALVLLQLLLWLQQE